MGAFFLHHKDAALSATSAEAVFARKGFAEARRFELGHWSMLTYHKMTLDVDNHIQASDEHAVFCCGTLVYQGLGYRDSLQRLLNDFRTGRIEHDRLLGHFCVFLWNGAKLSMLRDRLRVQHVFMNDRRTCLSSSFLAMVAAQPSTQRINRVALQEKLATGYIVGPDTLVEGISQLGEELERSLPAAPGIRILSHPSRPEEGESHAETFAESVGRQLAALKGYFADIRALDDEFSAELGLSSGFDSRLLLALSSGRNKPIALHSHNTSEAHRSELSIVRELASIGGNALTVVPTALPEEQDEEGLRSILHNTLYFFDGRCAHDMGSFSETYTAGYRKRVLGQHRLSLNGLGGEIYRNSWAAPRGRFSWDAWMDHAVFFPFAREICGDRGAFVDMRRGMTAKIARRLGGDFSRRIDLHAVRRCYGYVRMPDDAGSVSNAYNQVAFFLAPFIEPVPLREALKATRHIGSDGAYEAAMITALAPRLASVNSQYGFPFSSIPFGHIAMTTLKSMTPLPVLHARARRIHLRRWRIADRARHEALRTRSFAIREIEAVLKEACPKMDLDAAMSTYPQRCTCISVGSFLREFQGNLRWTPT